MNRMLSGRDGDLLISVMNNLDTARRFLTEFTDMGLRQRGMTTINMPDDVCIGLEHHILINQSGTRDRWTTRVYRALDAILACPSHHFLCFFTGLDRTKPYLTQELNARVGELFKVLLDHPFFNDGCACKYFDTPRTKVVKGPLCRDRQSLQTNDILWAPGQMHLAS